MDNKSLEIISYKIRKHAINAVYSAASGHPGGSLSIADILSVLYFDKMNITDPKDEMRDRFVLSKGHCSPALYGALCEKGFIKKEDITTFRHVDSFLQGHPDMKNVPGVDMSTGSLGQGVSTACGMAMNAKIDNKDYRVYAILGDGELEEGQVWEAAMFAAHYKLDNLTIFVDFNGLQIDGNISDVVTFDLNGMHGSYDLWKCFEVIKGSLFYGAADIFCDGVKLLDSKNYETLVGFNKKDFETGYGFAVTPHYEENTMQIHSCFADTELDFPNNFYFSYLAYLMAIAYKQKQNADATMLIQRANDEYAQFLTSISRDVAENNRIQNVYGGGTYFYG
jgi:transketolase N-terminal domain/subunit